MTKKNIKTFNNPDYLFNIEVVDKKARITGVNRGSEENPVKYYVDKRWGLRKAYFERGMEYKSAEILAKEISMRKHMLEATMTGRLEVPLFVARRSAHALMGLEEAAKLRGFTQKPYVYGEPIEISPPEGARYPDFPESEYIR